MRRDGCVVMRDSYEPTLEQREADEQRDEARRAADDERWSSPVPTTSDSIGVALVRDVYQGEQALASAFAPATREEIAAELKRGGPQTRLSLAMSILIKRIKAAA